MVSHGKTTRGRVKIAADQRGLTCVQCTSQLHYITSITLSVYKRS